MLNNRKKIAKMSLFLLPLALLLLYWLYYISTANPDYATYSLGWNKSSVLTHDLVNGKLDVDLLGMDEYAMLSNIVYRRKLNATVEQYMGWKHINIAMEDITPTDKSKVVVEGLYYELWEREAEHETTVAIVFKGTEGKGDWKANFRWVRRLFSKNSWDHYDQLGQISKKIVGSIKLRHAGNKPLKIIATGHSLGGGLAQFMAYAIPEIDLVYAFNSSPVTAYYDVLSKDRKKNKVNAKIFRIYESGEGLSFVRTFMTLLYPVPIFYRKDPAIMRIRFSFSTAKNAVNQHMIAKLAAHLKHYRTNTHFSE